jgi:hypothetical protein
VPTRRINKVPVQKKVSRQDEQYWRLTGAVGLGMGARVGLRVVGLLIGARVVGFGIGARVGTLVGGFGTGARVIRVPSGDNVVVVVDDGDGANVGGNGTFCITTRPSDPCDHLMGRVG